MRWHWQYAGGIVLSILNVDWILMPRLKAFGLEHWWLFTVSSILAVLELYCWYLFWNWFRRIALPEFADRVAEDNRIQEAIRVGREIETALKKAGLWEKIKKKVVDLFFNTFRKATDENNRLIKWVKRGGSVAMLFLGVSPEPGTRTFGAICCGTAGWKNGLYPLVLGNVLRIAYMVGVWDIIFKFFK